MTDDMALLEAAAKAAGVPPAMIHGQYWKPLTDDGDALRLAVKLGLQIFCFVEDKRYKAARDFTIHRGYLIDAEESGDDPYAATRRAIVRAAAVMGEKA